MDISIVVPVYNSEKSLPELVQRLAAVLPGLANRYELILVNDGSPDRSWETICELANRHDWVYGIDLMRNFGQHNALLCGIRQARFPITITMDDDLQHPPEELHLLLEKLAEGWDVVYGKPAQEKHNLWRDLASQITKLALQSAMGADTARNISALRVFRTRLRDSFAQFQGPYPSIDVLLTWGTTRFSVVAVHHEQRRYGASNYTFGKLVRHAMNMMTGFSILPLQLASVMGFTFALFGVGVLIYVIGRYIILGGSVPGFPFLASIIAIFAGVQLFSLGIIGEYLARVHLRLLEKPPYTVARQVQFSGEAQREYQ